MLTDNVEVRLTTIDNPFDPFTQFNEWFLFDVQKGYNCCSLIDRVANILPSMTENEVYDELESAINNIIAADSLDIYKKVYRTTEDTSDPLPSEEE